MKLNFAPIEPLKPKAPEKIIEKRTVLDILDYNCPEQDITITDIKKKLPKNIKLNQVVITINNGWDNCYSTFFYISQIENPKYDLEMKKFNKDLNIYNKKYAEYQLAYKEYEKLHIAEDFLVKSQALEKAEKELKVVQRKVEKLKQSLK